jgi:hypothetical protein
MKASPVENWVTSQEEDLQKEESLPTTRLDFAGVLTPEQFFVLVEYSHKTWTPERRLLLAVLGDAVDIFLHYRSDHSAKGDRLFQETLEWFASPDRKSLCAFESICDHLNLDAQHLRQGLWSQVKSRAGTAILLTLPSHPLKRTNLTARSASEKR